MEVKLRQKCWWNSVGQAVSVPGMERQCFVLGPLVEVKLNLFIKPTGTKIDKDISISIS